MKASFCIFALSLLFDCRAVQAVETDESWRHYGADAGGTRFSPHRQIAPGNIGDLRLAWTYRTGDISDGKDYPGESSFKATPILHNDMLYISTPFNRVVALNSSTGEEVWSFDPAVNFSQRYAEMFTSRSK